MRMRTFLLSITLLLTACAGSAKQPTGQPANYQGTLKRICSPVDATGLELRLHKQAGTGPPLVVIELWAPLPRAGTEPVELTGSADTGALMICQSDQDCQLLQRGYLIIETENSLGPGSGVFWSTGDQVHGRFTASPIDNPDLICG